MYNTKMGLKMNHEQITNGFQEAKKNLEKSLQFFNDMMSDYGNKENVLYDKCMDNELDTIREDLSHIEDAIY